MPECVREVVGQRKVSMAMLPCLANILREFMLRESKHNLEVRFGRSRFKNWHFPLVDYKAKIIFI